jgi:ATP-dependent Lon protease
MEEVLANALVRQPKAIVWEEDPKAPAPPVATDDEGPGVVAH